ncbi:hypothetical protein CC78DRAFT_547218 [Lojkania enalia]|uniref:Uncharacterized protein n=1 Tax=Lojkania enalia TaxID=147567 RepID=A0A9P4MX03_9PLEO|nr:hypothetical protein CC78DRAFT_547218 [Didymosphaeria enalia]
MSPPHPPSRDPPFFDDDSGGEVATIYVFDGYFDMSIPLILSGSSGTTGRLYHWEFFVGNNLAFPSDANAFLTFMRATFLKRALRTNDISGGYHGTMAAVTIRGRVDGISPKVDLDLVKTKNYFNRGDQGSENRNHVLWALVLRAALDEV